MVSFPLNRLSDQVRYCLRCSQTFPGVKWTNMYSLQMWHLWQISRAQWAWVDWDYMQESRCLSGSCMTTHPHLSVSSGTPCTGSLASQRVLSPGLAVLTAYIALERGSMNFISFRNFLWHCVLTSWDLEAYFLYHNDGPSRRECFSSRKQLLNGKKYDTQFSIYENYKPQHLLWEDNDCDADTEV